MPDDVDDTTVEIPAWVAREALQEFDFLIKRTGGGDASVGHDAVTPLALLRQRLASLEDAEGIDAFTLRHVRQHLLGVASERGVELSDADPLTDRTFQARDELEDALEVAFEDHTADVEGDA